MQEIAGKKTAQDQTHQHQFDCNWNWKKNKTKELRLYQNHRSREYIA